MVLELSLTLPAKKRSVTPCIPGMQFCIGHTHKKTFLSCTVQGELKSEGNARISSL
jgi:hypothetical protein